MAIRVVGHNSLDLYLPEDAVAVLLINAGIHPDLPGGRLRLFGFKEELKWPDGRVAPGVYQPLIFWYIENAEKKIVVDTGANDESVRVANEAFRVRGQGQVYVREARHSVRDFLRSRGTSPEQIDYVVLSHLHLDHFLNAGEFPNATFIVQKDELAWGIAPPIYAEFHWREFSANITSVLDRVQVIDGDVTLCRGVEVVRVGGHTPGSQAVVIRNPNGTIVLAGDFFYNYKNIEYSWPVGAFFNLEEWIRNCARLKSIGEVIVPTHDFYFWEEFPSGVIE